ncbi:MAG: HYExAFE family protein [Planctomycetia bacterium]|nr:HYExAFE family protein [Planctomycetia bacterium]
MQTFNHYEKAFEAYIQFWGLSCLATQERRRSLEPENQVRSLKNLDFIIPCKRPRTEIPWSCLTHDALEANEDALARDSISPSELAHFSWLIDVKGRRFPSGQKNPQYWRNWVTQDDIVSLARWENIFGADFCGLFVFVYDIVGDRSPVEPRRLFEYRQHLYAFLGIPLAVYSAHCRPLSARWGTVSLPPAEFRRLAVPLDEVF